MKGLWKMLTGRGEREYRQEHQQFKDAIPQDFPFKAGGVVRFGPRATDVREATPEDEDLPRHPAYEGKLASTLTAANYRRSLPQGGISKREHRRRARAQTLVEAWQDEVAQTGRRTSFQDWLQQNGIPLPE